MAQNNAYPECYVTSDCYLICKGGDGAYELPGVGLSQSACIQKRSELASQVTGDRDQEGTSRYKGGLGWLNWDVPQLFDLRGVLQKIAKALNVDVEKLVQLAKTMLIVGAVIIVLVLLKTISRK